jgi:hypothetical protein
VAEELSIPSRGYLEAYSTGLRVTGQLLVPMDYGIYQGHILTLSVIEVDYHIIPKRW